MFASLALLAVLGPHPDALRVLVVANRSSPVSREIAEHYMARRGVRQVVWVDCPDSSAKVDSETIPYASYRRQIEDPVRTALKGLPKVDFVVLTKGIPIRIVGGPRGIGDGRASVDSTLASLGYETRNDVQPVEISDSGFQGKAWINRFWASTKRFRRQDFGGVLVTRLDGYTTEEAKSLVVSAIQSEQRKPSGRFLFDATGPHSDADVAAAPLNPVRDGKPDVKVINEMAYSAWDADVVRAGRDLQKRGYDVHLDTDAAFIGRKGGLAGYASWGSNDGKFDAEGYRMLRFEPGALAETAVSTSARTFLPTTGGQSLVADLIHARVTGVKGYSDEPLLQAVASPTILFDRYTRGWTLAESYYAASRFVGWQDIVVGDPLAAPYAKR